MNPLSSCFRLNPSVELILGGWLLLYSSRENSSEGVVISLGGLWELSHCCLAGKNLLLLISSYLAIDIAINVAVNFPQGFSLSYLFFP
jgi:hypothetical protein